MSKKERVDVLVVEQGLAESREKAQALILAGKICAGDTLLSKPGQKIDPNTKLRVRGQTDDYVSRGAYKLLGALDTFKINLQDKVCLDVGASTGGFTQVCLERGALKVYALDVGHNQLHWKLRSDSRVKSLEGVNVRQVGADILPEKVDFICVDTSFISLKLVLPSLSQFFRSGDSLCSLVALIKPQHEVGKEQVGKGGLVRDAALHESVTKDISQFAQTLGFSVAGLIESSIKGTTGNKEFLIYLTL